MTKKLENKPGITELHRLTGVREESEFQIIVNRFKV